MEQAKIDCVVTLAEQWMDTNVIITYAELAEYLNERGFTTTLGKPYAGKRGTASLVASIFRRLMETDPIIAFRVMFAFGTVHGTYPFDMEA